MKDKVGYSTIKTCVAYASSTPVEPIPNQGLIFPIQPTCTTHLGSRETKPSKTKWGICSLRHPWLAPLPFPRNQTQQNPTCPVQYKHRVQMRFRYPDSRNYTTQRPPGRHIVQFCRPCHPIHPDSIDHSYNFVPIEAILGIMIRLVHFQPRTTLPHSTPFRRSSSPSTDSNLLLPPLTPPTLLMLTSRTPLLIPLIHLAARECVFAVPIVAEEISQTTAADPEIIWGW